jgi:hypothetical protein
VVLESETTTVKQWAANLSERFLLCRELGHNWKPLTARWDGPGGIFVRTLRCTRCRTERHQSLTRRGHVLQSNYTYPEGYTMTGLGRIVGEDRDQLRLESITRHLTED